MAAQTAQTIVAQSCRGTISFAVRLDGRREAEEYLKALPSPSRMKFAVLFKHVVDREIHNEERMIPIDSPLGIGKIHIQRDNLVCISDGQDLILTHGYRGVKFPTPVAQVQRALVIRDEHFQIATLTQRAYSHDADLGRSTSDRSAVDGRVPA